MIEARRFLFALTWLFMGTIAALTVAGALLAVLYSSPRASAQTRFELLTGNCSVTWSGDGVWYNSNYPGAIDTSAPCGQVSVSRITGQWHGFNTGWRLAYVDLGTLRWTATYPLRDDEQFTLVPDGKTCDYASLHGCVGTGTHWQNEQGLSFGWVIETTGRVSLGLDGGLFLYYGEYQFTRSSWPVEGIFPTSTTPQYGGWQVTPYAGLTARWGYLFAQVRRYASIKAAEHGCGNCSGLSHGAGQQVNVGLSIPF